MDSQGDLVAASKGSVDFRRISFEEAKALVRQWHYKSQNLHVGTDCFGAEKDGKLIAAAVFVDCRSHDCQLMGELIATVKDPNEKFQISRLLKYSRKQLKKKYQLLITFCDARSLGPNGELPGGQLRGDFWQYSGITKNVSLDQDIFLDMFTLGREFGYHLYWVALNKAGTLLAISKGLEANPYPK